MKQGATYEDVKTRSLDLVVFFIFKNNFEKYRPKNLKSTGLSSRPKADYNCVLVAGTKQK